MSDPIELVIFDCDGVLEGPGTVVFDEMRDLPRLLGPDPDI